MVSEINGVASQSPMPVSPQSSATGRLPNNGTEAGSAEMAQAAADLNGLESTASERVQGNRNTEDTSNLHDQVTDAVERINEMMQNGKQMLKFQVDDDSGRMVVRVMDAQTEEVIRQIPSEETLKFAEYVDGLVGLIFNKKA